MFVCVHSHIQEHAPYRMGLVNRCSIGLQEVPTEPCVRICLTAIFIWRLWYLMYKPVVVCLTTRWKNCFTYNAISVCVKYRKLCWQVSLSLLLVIWHQWDLQDQNCTCWVLYKHGNPARSFLMVAAIAAQRTWVCDSWGDRCDMFLCIIQLCHWRPLLRWGVENHISS